MIGVGVTDSPEDDDVLDGLFIGTRKKTGRAGDAPPEEIGPGPAAAAVAAIVRRRASRGALVALLAGATLLPATPLPAQRAELDKRIQRRSLENGLEVIVVENRGVPLVTVEANVRNGAFVQSAATAGLAHLYEHMFFGANATYPRSGDYLARLSELGADYNGSTSEERVNYYMTLPSDSLEGGLRVLASALRAPSFRAEELERERQVVIGEYDRNESDPFHHLSTAMGRALWTTAWDRKNALGERAVILAATPAQMKEIQRKYYVPNNTAVIVTGDVAPERAFALAQEVFGDWPAAADPFHEEPVPPVPPLVRDTAVVVEQPIGGAVVVMLQWQGPGARSDVAATYAADVFSDALNQPGSRFQQRLVDSGLFQGVHVNYYTLNHVGPITVSGQTTPGKLRSALAALEAELGRVLEPDYFTQEELDAVKRQRVVGTLMGLERASGFAHQLGFWWSVTGLDYFLGYVDAMAGQSPDDLRAYARRYIVGRPRVTGVLMSPEARRAVGLTADDLMKREAIP
jgi:zinc protease